MFVKLNKEIEIINSFFSVSFQNSNYHKDFELHLQYLGTFTHLHRKCSEWISTHNGFYTFYKGMYKTVGDIYSGGTSLLTYLLDINEITLTDKQIKVISNNLLKANSILNRRKEQKEKNKLVIERAIERRKYNDVFQIRKSLKEDLEWSKKVKERDNFNCKNCGSVEKLVAHHLNNYRDFPLERFDLDNGITLCVTCRNRYQKEYGRKNNTKQQIKEFLCITQQYVS